MVSTDIPRRALHERVVMRSPAVEAYNLCLPIT